MAAVDAFPITVAPEALARVAELGLQTEFEQMLEHTKQSVPGLRAIDVVLAHDPECVEEPRIILEAYCGEPASDYDPTQWNWNAWAIATFTPEIFQHFVLMTVYEPSNGR